MRKLVPLALALTMVAAACGGGDGEETTTTTSSTTTTVSAVTVPPTTAPAPTTTSTTTTTTTTTLPPANVWPLTGEAGYVEGTPTLFVKIDNTSRGRPQEGLEAADLVFEIVVEGGIPRLLAGFQSEVPDVIGPVRSARETDAKLLYPFAAYFANSGGQSFVREMVNRESKDISHPRLGGSYFRERGRPGVYDLMLRATKALERVGPPKRDSEVVMIHGPPPAGGLPAGTIALSMSNSQTSNWTWSEEDGLYLRGNNGNPHLAASGEQIAAANVIALEAEQILLERTDSAGSRVPDYRLVGPGRMTLFRDGVAYTGTWGRDNLRAWYWFVDEDGTDLPLAVGPTWIEIVPAGRSIDYS